MNQFTVLVPKVLGNFRFPSVPFRLSRVAFGVVGIATLIGMAVPASARTYRLNSDEMIVHKRISTSSGQKRAAVNLDPTLCIVARKRAADMAKRDYFGHTNPEGLAANFLVRRAGYVLPLYYDSSRSANNIESIGMSVGKAQEVVALWQKSASHRPHILGEHEFYQQQSSVGIGVYRSAKAPYYKYYVFLSAPPNASLLPVTTVLKMPESAASPTTGK